MYAVLNLRPFDPAHVNAMPRRVRYVGTVVIAPAKDVSMTTPASRARSIPWMGGPAVVAPFAVSWYVARESTLSWTGA